MRWKTIQFSYNKNNDSKTEWYRLKLLSSLRPVNELTLFENELISLVKNIKFRKVRNYFRDQLRRMKASNKTMTFADKTTNIYRLTRGEYEKY